MAIVFISHSSRDEAFAKQLAVDLQLGGHKPWIDDTEVRPGQSVMSAVQDGLNRARHVIVVLSHAAVQSHWIEAEWKEKFWETLTNQKMRVIPVLLEPCEIPMFLRTLRYANFTKSYAVGFAELCLTLRPSISQVPNTVSLDMLRAIEYSARTHGEDHIRLACAHAVWSCRPDRAKAILEDALQDYCEAVRSHAGALLDEFY